jgi:hypothetical protein
MHTSRQKQLRHGEIDQAPDQPEKKSNLKKGSQSIRSKETRHLSAKLRYDQNLPTKRWKKRKKGKKILKKINERK